MQVSNLTAFEWAYQHVGLVAWPTLLAFAWKASSWFNDVKNQIGKTVGQVDKMSTDYFPAMRDSLKTQDGHLASMDTSLKTMADSIAPRQFATAQTARRKNRKR